MKAKYKSRPRSSQHPDPTPLGDRLRCFSAVSLSVTDELRMLRYCSLEASLVSYKSVISSLNKHNLISLDDFYTNELPLFFRAETLILTSRSSTFRSISSLDETLIQSASVKAFLSLPDISRSISELTVLKGVDPATASPVLATCFLDVAPFMSDEAMVAVSGNARPHACAGALVILAAVAQEKIRRLPRENMIPPLFKLGGDCIYTIRHRKGFVEFFCWRKIYSSCR